MGRRRYKYGFNLPRGLNKKLEKVMIKLTVIFVAFSIVLSVIGSAISFAVDIVLQLSPLGLFVSFISIISLVYLVLQMRNYILLNRQEKIRNRIAREAHADKLKSMDPLAFEEYIAEIFRLQGFIATVTPPTCDRGKDVILRKGKEIRLIECKRYNALKVTRPDVQKFHSAIIDSNATWGYFITTGYFTKPATEYVTDKPIHLIDLPKLLDLIKKTINDDVKEERKTKFQFT